jgi:Mn-dependent DtxR family transcriptional regulator
MTAETFVLQNAEAYAEASEIEATLDEATVQHFIEFCFEFNVDHINEDEIIAFVCENIDRIEALMNEVIHSRN